MIQVCSACGTRWNVRDRRRVWCPRCNGTLLAPSAPAPDPEWGARPSASPLRPSAGPTPPRLPPGYRWIAVRPGMPPPPRRGPSIRAVQGTLIATMVVLGIAALIHVIRYALLIVNRSILLNPWVAGAATWLGVAVSVIAVFMVVASAVVLTNWLIARRAAAFAYRGHEDPRTTFQLRFGCLLPLANLAWAPVYVIELAAVEDRLTWLRRPIVVWWLVWVASTALSVFSIATSFTTDAQGIANNTVTTIVAYLAGMAALLLAMKVFGGFERQPVERPTRRWVMVAEENTAAEPAAPVESEGQNPAA